MMLPDLDWTTLDVRVRLCSSAEDLVDSGDPEEWPSVTWKGLFLDGELVWYGSEHG